MNYIIIMQTIINVAELVDWWLDVVSVVVRALGQ